MNADVYIAVVRKSDGCPFERIYLGGNRLRDNIFYECEKPLQTEATVMGCQVSKFENSKAVEKFIQRYLETIQAYSDVTEFEYHNDQDYHYWLLIEE